MVKDDCAAAHVRHLQHSAEYQQPRSGFRDDSNIVRLLERNLVKRETPIDKRDDRACRESDNGKHPTRHRDEISDDRRSRHGRSLIAVRSACNAAHLRT